MIISGENEDKFMIEGRNPVLEVLRSDKSIDKIIIAKDAHGISIAEILKRAKEKGIVVQYVDKRNLDKMSSCEANQGVIAITAPYEYKDIGYILDLASKRGQQPFIVILDSITDPHNLGAIVRTAECAGVHGIIIPKRRAVGITAAVVKASAGALEYVAVARVSNISTTIDELKQKGLWIAGADSSGVNYTKHDLNTPLVLVIGSEDKGISRLVKEKCDYLVGITLNGKVESLNASVAAAILMYEVVRQRSIL